MATNIEYLAESLTALGLDNTGTAPNTLTSLVAAGAGATNLTSPAYDNTVNNNLWADFLLDVTFGTAPVAGTTVDLYLIYSYDGTNYEDGVASNTPASVIAPITSYVGSWSVRAVATAQLIILKGVVLRPLKFNVLVVNQTGQAFKSSGTLYVKIIPYRQQIV